MKLLSSGSKESLNVKGAYFEVLADMLGSLGVIIAAGVVLLTGWRLVDPITGAGIGLFIVPRTWILLKQAIHILMEGGLLKSTWLFLRKACLRFPASLPCAIFIYGRSLPARIR